MAGRRDTSEVPRAKGRLDAQGRRIPITLPPEAYRVAKQRADACGVPLERVVREYVEVALADRRRAAMEASSAPPRAAVASAPRRRPHQPPRWLKRGIVEVNRLRRAASGDEAAALRPLDEACAKALTVWALAVIDRRPQPPASPEPKLTPAEALVVGLLVALHHQPHYGSPDAELLLGPAGTDVRMGLSGTLAKLLTGLARHPEWRGRIRRCGYRRCYRLFVDRSPKKDAVGCCPSHSVRLNEVFGARKPRGPRKKPRLRIGRGVKLNH